ncbi:expressed unknown protein [Ectocarpus siliculosus]|uniref:Uncharacterized protein n=1 Tax=Ectocarpus siliculosus TaxID=2880 RepID=D7G3B5_ECTSI|nr:expressed unknown protein [Ectocarpus siliculosus]|eukprot:CBJ33509.1 expressed unknown protein [Ectocarpus siliculosus]
MDSEWVLEGGALTRNELQLLPAVRGRAAFERARLAAKPISMECVERKKKETSDGGRETRTVFLPVDRARVKHAAGDGSCGYHSIRGGLLGCKGQVNTPHDVDAIKTALVSCLLRHVLGTKFDPEATLSGDEKRGVSKAKLLRIKEEEDEKAKEAAEAAKAAKGGARAAPKKPKKRRQPKPVVEEEEEEEEVDESWDWSERGIPDFENTDAYKRRNKKPSAGSSASPVSLSQSAQEKMPSLDQFMEAIGINSGAFAIEQVKARTTTPSGTSGRWRKF